MNEQDKQLQEVMEQLSVLEPTAADAPRPARQAFARLQAQLASPERPNWLARLGQHLLGPQRRLATAVSLAITLLIITFSFPAVRAAPATYSACSACKNLPPSPFRQNSWPC